MYNDFLICSKDFNFSQGKFGLNLFFENDYLSIYSKNNESSNVNVLLNGYVLPKNSIKNKYPVTDSINFIHTIYSTYGDEIINHIKGLFTVVLITDSCIKVFTDQLGISKFFYYQNNNSFYISNNYRVLSSLVKEQINTDALAVKSLLNREINGLTINSNICYSTPATFVSISKNEVTFNKYWHTESALQSSKSIPEFDDFVSLLTDNIQSYQATLNPAHTAITLTGGKDSRTALCALLNLGIKPVGLTYGSPNSRDAVYAGILAKSAGLEHVIVTPERTQAWFEEAANSVINLNNPLINIHRGHRLFAINAIKETIGADTLLYNGYMGGELLMGIYFDDLIFTDFIKDFWQKGESQFNLIPSLLKERFLRVENLNIDSIKNRLFQLSSFNSKSDLKTKQFNALFEIGVLHHSQDIQIANRLLGGSAPFFLDLDFIELLFRSQYSFLNQDVNSKNLFKRYSMFEFNLNLQHRFYPQLDNMYFAKKGTYSTAEFLKGPMYWSLVKTIRYFTENKKYPPTFAYNNNYNNFLLQYLNEIVLDKASPINQVYNVELAISTLKQQEGLTTESQLHKYSNIVMHYMQFKQYSNTL